VILLDRADRRVVVMPLPAELYALRNVTNNDRLVVKLSGGNTSLSYLHLTFFDHVGGNDLTD
jgi:hypothetical protein